MSDENVKTREEKISEGLLKYYEENESIHLGKVNSEETKHKISQTLKEFYAENGHHSRGVDFSETHCEKISEGLQKYFSEMSEEERLERNTRYAGSNNGMFGKTHSQEARDKISKGLGKVILFDGIEYDSLASAHRITGKTRRTIRTTLRLEMSKGNPKYFFEDSPK
jgi:hypothetical protein